MDTPSRRSPAQDRAPRDHVGGADISRPRSDSFRVRLILGRPYGTVTIMTELPEVLTVRNGFSKAAEPMSNDLPRKSVYRADQVPPDGTSKRRDESPVEVRTLFARDVN